MGWLTQLFGGGPVDEVSAAQADLKRATKAWVNARMAWGRTGVGTQEYEQAEAATLAAIEAVEAAQLRLREAGARAANKSSR